MKISVPNETKSFSEHPRIYKKEHVRCGDVKQNCEAKRKSCQNTRSCARDCSRFDVICKARAEACRVGARADAERCRVNERLRAETCRAGQDLEVKNCKLNNEAKVAACKTKVEGMRMLEDFLDIGEIEGKVNVSNISVITVLNKIELNNELNEVTVNTDLKVSANLNVDINYNPEGVGHAACLWKTKPNINTSLSIDEKQFTVSGRVNPHQNDDSTMTLNIKINGSPITIQAKNSPWKELTKDKSFKLSCTVGGISFRCCQFA
jgi:hypothetical protein